MSALYAVLAELAVWLLAVPAELAAIALRRSTLRRLAQRLGAPPAVPENGDRHQLIERPSTAAGTLGRPWLPDKWCLSPFSGTGGRLVLLHAVSVGEMAAAGALAAAWSARRPADRLVLTAGTADGLAAGERIAATLSAVAAVVPLPWDRPRAQRRFVRALAPSLVVVIETEIWPGLFAACAELGVPLALASARVYPRDVARYRLLPRFFRRVLALPAWIGVASDGERDRLLAIGAPAAIVEVTGNLKLDRSPLATAPFDGGSPRPPASAVRRIVGVSTHRDDEAALIAAFVALRRQRSNLQLVLAPRHPRRAGACLRAARRHGLVAALLDAATDAPAPPDVVVVDRLGVLPALLDRATVAVIGGTFGTRGGQSPIEAARAGVATVVGPSVEHFGELVADWGVRGALCRVVGASDLAPALAALLDDEAARARLVTAAAAEVREGACADRYVERLGRLVGVTAPASASAAR